MKIISNANIFSWQHILNPYTIDMEAIEVLVEYYDWFCDWLIANTARLAAIKLKYPENRGYLSREKALIVKEISQWISSLDPEILSYYLAYRLQPAEIQHAYQTQEVLASILFIVTETDNGSKKKSSSNNTPNRNDQAQMISVLRPWVMKSDFRKTHESESEGL